MPDNFTCQGESAATQWVKCCTSFHFPHYFHQNPSWYSGSCFGILDMHALIFSRFTYNQQDDDVTKKIEKYASPRLIYPLGPSKCTPCMMFVAEGMGVTKLKTVNILNAVVCLHIMCIMLKV